MDRRRFLALIASAPIGALAPWPQFLPHDRELGISIRYIKQWESGVIVTPMRVPRPYMSLPRTPEEIRATEMVNAARARFNTQH